MDHRFTATFTSLCTQHILRLSDLYGRLIQLHHLRTAVIHELATKGLINMSTLSPPPNDSPPREKLLVIRFLNTHLAQGGIEQYGYDMLYRMVMIISATGKELHTIIQSHIAHVSVIRRMEWYATCISEGCEVFRRHFERRLRNARTAATQLPELDGVKEEGLKEVLRVWREALGFLHLPTGNDGGLFRHMANHFDDLVYRDFLQLHRRKPESLAWCLNERLTAVQQALETIHESCTAADSIVESLDEEFDIASRRLRRWTRGQAKAEIVPHPAPQTQISDVRGIDASPVILKSPQVTEGPPQLPPLPFQAFNYEATVPPAQPSSLSAGDAAKHPTFNKSFSAVEEQVAHRGHFRNATVANTGYKADPSGGVGLGIAQPYPRHPYRGPPVGVRRQGSVSIVPRVFTGSFSELESDIFDLKLHKVQTPEDQPATPDMSTSPTDGPVVRDFADATKTPSMCPSPVTLLQRREALVSKDVQWESRVVNGEVVRSRRPSEKIQRSLTIDERTGGLDEWLSQHSPAEQSSPFTPGSAIRRGLLKHRENTL